MERLRIAIEELVSAGIRSYIDLLGHGERARSRQLFKDALQLSALMSGGPSSRISPILIAEASTPGNDHPMRSCLILLTLRSILATLLVLKASAYWRRVPVLAELQARCLQVANCVGPQVGLSPGGVHPGARTSGHTSGRTARSLNCANSPETDTACGGRRNNALPTVPELTERSPEEVGPGTNPKPVPAQ